MSKRYETYIVGNGKGKNQIAPHIIGLSDEAMDVLVPYIPRKSKSEIFTNSLKEIFYTENNKLKTVPNCVLGFKEDVVITVDHVYIPYTSKDDFRDRLALKRVEYNITKDIGIGWEIDMLIKSVETRGPANAIYYVIVKIVTVEDIINESAGIDNYVFNLNAYTAAHTLKPNTVKNTGFKSIISTVINLPTASDIKTYCILNSVCVNVYDLRNNDNVVYGNDTVYTNNAVITVETKEDKVTKYINFDSIVNMLTNSALVTSDVGDDAKNDLIRIISENTTWVSDMNLTLQKQLDIKYMYSSNNRSIENIKNILLTFKKENYR